MRLIDADALSKDLEKRWNVSDDQDFCNKEVWHALEEAPTIEPDGDTISRRDALAEFRDGRDVYDIMESIEELPSAPSAEAEQVTGKLNNPDDSLLTADSEACKEQKSKLDLISRQAVLSLFPNSFYSGLAKQINALPSAPDSRQRGEWVANHILDSMLCECDQCGFDCGAYTFNFCPSCGADMRKGGEDE